MYVYYYIIIIIIIIIVIIFLVKVVMFCALPSLVRMSTDSLLLR